jgi:cation diffusion facilitator family transporter
VTTHDLAAHVHNRSGERRTRWVVLLTFAMMVSELIIGSITNSVALEADGWHMGTHVAALGLTLVAYWYTRTRANRVSFGTGKVYALAGYTSGILLALVALFMAYEGAEQLIHHRPVDYGDALPVAVVGLVVNIISMMLLGHQHHYGHDHQVAKPEAGTLDFNLRAAYIHILADAMTSILAIGALAAGRYAGLWYFDPLMGFIGGGVIVWWAVSLCRQAGRQLLDVVSGVGTEAAHAHEH